jgi:hypothetical protein
MDVAAAKLDDFRLDALRLERLKDVVEQDARVAIGTWTAIEGDYFHAETPVVLKAHSI